MFNYQVRIYGSNLQYNYYKTSANDIINSSDWHKDLSVSINEDCLEELISTLYSTAKELNLLNKTRYIYYFMPKTFDVIIINFDDVKNDTWHLGDYDDYDDNQNDVYDNYWNHEINHQNLMCFGKNN